MSEDIFDGGSQISCMCNFKDLDENISLIKVNGIEIISTDDIKKHSKCHHCDKDINWSIPFELYWESTSLDSIETAGIRLYHKNCKEDVKGDKN